MRVALVPVLTSSMAMMPIVMTAAIVPLSSFSSPSISSPSSTTPGTTARNLDGTTHNTHSSSSSSTSSFAKRIDDNFFPMPSTLLTLNAGPLVGKPANDFSCRSPHGYNPVITLHGLSANDQVDLNQLQHHLNAHGFCTFSLTYGAHALAPWVGGLTPMRDSAAQIAEFTREVSSRTGSDRVDLVGHSEGGVMALYVPLVESAAVEGLVEHTVSLGPAVHGARYYGFTDLWYLGGQVTRSLAGKVLDVLGCAACDDMATGGRVYNDFLAASSSKAPEEAGQREGGRGGGGGGGIVQKGVKASIVMSRADTLVAPEVSRVDEDGVRNVYVQDYCPDDWVGHAGLAWDTGVWDIIVNELTEGYDRDGGSKGIGEEGSVAVACSRGLPF